MYVYMHRCLSQMLQQAVLLTCCVSVRLPVYVYEVLCRGAHGYC